MGAIAVLDEKTIDQIAAGEVIERPSSVVKELVENAIDAGATAITVEIREGGIGMIRITDNGSGIRKSDVPLAFMRHATSKIRTIEDLLQVSSLGFRGEALSSIAAIAQVELITKTVGEMTGSRYLIEGGVERGFEEIGAPEGTTFLVRNLFYNTPARRKFLKTPVTEGNYINTLMEKIVLSCPHISFKLLLNGQVKLHTLGNGNLKDMIYAVYGRDMADNLLELRASDGPVALEGYLGRPAIARSNRNFENYYVNQRYIKSSVIQAAIEEGCKSFMMQRKYPFTVFHLSIPQEQLDVNVHPSKMELRFSDNEAVYRFIQEAVQSCLHSQELIWHTGFGDGSGKSGKPSGQKDRHQIPEPFETKRREAMLAEAETAKQGRFSIEAGKTETGTGTTGQRQFPMEMGDTEVETASGAEGQGRFPMGGIAMESGKTPGRTEENRLSEAFDAKGREPLQGMAEGLGRFSVERGNTGAGTGSVEQGRFPVEREKLETGSEWDQAQPWDQRSQDTFQDGNGSPQTWLAKDGIIRETGDYRLENPTQLSLPRSLFSENTEADIRIIGQAFGTYWIVELDENLYIIDQHAAHEKVLYERIMGEFSSKTFTSQILSPPLLFTLSSAEEEALARYGDYFAKLGFEITHFGGKDYAVSAIPANLYGLAGAETFRELMDQLAGSAHFSQKDSPDLILEKVASMACKAAVKGNSRISGVEAQSLIRELMTLENPYNCPHGRPTIISMTRHELEKKFRRIL